MAGFLLKLSNAEVDKEAQRLMSGREKVLEGQEEDSGQWQPPDQCEARQPFPRALV